MITSSGWWFGTFFIFLYIGNNHPNWLILFRGVGIPPTSHPLMTQECRTTFYHRNSAGFAQHAAEIGITMKFLFMKVVPLQQNSSRMLKG
jgi:hypothetical protein